MPTATDDRPGESTSQNDYAADVRLGEVTELPQNLKRQFYPPLVLLDALNAPTVLKRRSYNDSTHGDTYDPEKIFHHFVSRVALICQVEPNGDAVSSCVVLQEPDRVEYVFTSNHRTKKQLASVAQALRGILDMVPPMDEESDKDDLEIRSKMLRAVLALSWCRVRRYLNALSQELRPCMASCERKGTEREKIASLTYTAAELAKTAKTDDHDQFSFATEAVIRELESLRKDSYLFSLICRSVAVEHKQANGMYWTEMCHISDRLKAYKGAIDSMFIARDNWPELFETFEVRFIPSSSRMGNVLAGGAKTAAQLVRVCTSDKNILPELEASVATLQNMHDIDDIINQTWTGGIKPVIHSEVQLHSWLESTGRTHPERFFGRYKFIGSSKPTCKLCSFYFDEHGTDVKVLPSHRNIYLQWRMPDVLDYGSPDDLEERKNVRKDLLHKIKKRVVADIVRTIKEKRADSQNHDSTDQRGRDLRSYLNASVADTMSSAMDNLSIVGEVDEVSDTVDTHTINFPGRDGLMLARRL
ncbi:uncharacterized protein DNG_04458 [Cephalotrichum gorgonifer]|uniref:Uncharacterized protein n=1 Tax=Cephalotrichum gorgonifer TaxID=2041049 RepID=A0AAE8SUJ9_9PEZI|nr:uncharacterized protein DNG_04458 [Cephalotrichum gorgonifer]